MNKTKHLILSFLVISLLWSCSNKKNDENDKEVRKKPNIVVILTDQERYPTHWPEGWAEKNLRSANRLKKNGITFTRAYTAACECTPSRAVLYSSEYSTVNKLPVTPPGKGGLPAGKELMDIGTLLKDQAGYDVVWKGKWHLSPPLNGGHDWTTKDIYSVQERYDISGWNPPDAGTAITESVKNPDGTNFNGLTTLGGGFANNDGRFLEGANKNDPKQIQGWGESILDYINKVASTPEDKRQPFCLFISFVNPHDVWVYPSDYEKAGYKKDDFANLSLPLPQNLADSLETKPSVQLKARESFQKISPLTEDQYQGYVNFYAHLNKLADSNVQAVLDALDKAGLTENTIIIRTADHGELGLSHGMREKAYTVYEEMIHVPLIISNPKLFPEPQRTEAFYCHLDLMPTIAELAQVPNFEQYGKGVSVVPVLKNPRGSVQDSILFAYDDIFFLPKDIPGGHIRAIREGDWTYAVYYSEDGSNFEYELYNLRNDPLQMKNLLFKNPSPDAIKEANRLHKKLKGKIDKAQALPKDFPWPAQPLVS